MAFSRGEVVTIPSPIELHAHLREPGGEDSETIESGAETARYIANQGHPVHWCHISSEDEVRQAEKLTKDFPVLFTSEVTLHHLTMTKRSADFQYGWNGGRMQPPLGEEVDAEMLLDAYNRGVIQVMATDHAPHTTEAKLKAEADNPEGINEADQTTCYGVSGIEFVLPVMMSLVQRNLVSLDRVVDSLYDQPRRVLGIPENSPMLTATTLLEIKERILGPEDVVGKSSNTPYINWTAWGRVIAMRKNGKLIHLGEFRDENLPRDPITILTAQQRAA